MEKAKVNICINFTKKLPVENIEKNIDKLSVLLNKKELIKEFVQKSDRRLVVSREDSLGDFIKSEFNCEFDSYRSPHSNKYFPPRESAKFPPSELRELEIILNRIFKEYTKLYYGNTAIPSVYVWEQGESIDNGFYCALLIKNSVGTLRGLEKAEWDSVNIVNIKFSNEKEKYTERIKATYKIYTNIIFKFKASNMNTEWSGSISRQSEESYFIKSFLDYEFHLEKIGKLVEVTENSILTQLETVYFKKSNEVLDKLRSTVILGKPNQSLANNLNQIFSDKSNTK